MKDLYSRDIDYVRISVTDRCNLRCIYCMPEGGIPKVKHEDILSFEEILHLSSILAAEGIRKIRITGGEPLVRKDLPNLIAGLKQIPGIEKVTMTSNGVLLRNVLPELISAGIDGINVSLDTLDKEKYKIITGNDCLEDVIYGIDACLAAAEFDLKINAVTMKGRTHEKDIISLAALSKVHSLSVRFIEMMPMGLGQKYPGYSQDEIMRCLIKNFGTPKIAELNRSENGTPAGSGPAVYYAFDGFKGRIGFISPLTHEFCKNCNRLRLTSTGILKPCLNFGEGVDLRTPVRNNVSDEILSALIRKCILMKPEQHCFNRNTAGTDDEYNTEKHFMSYIGG